MTVAWTTFVVILLLLPGLAFFTGFWSQERYSREIVRSTAIGEVGMAVFMAVVIHAAAIGLLHAIFKFNFFTYFAPIERAIEQKPAGPILGPAEYIIDAVVIYTIAICVISFCIGLSVARIAMFGFLRRYFATHGWAYDLIREKNRAGGLVTTYVLTNIVDEKTALMYVGELEDFFLEASGAFSYIVLKNCSRFYLTLDRALPATAQRVPLYHPDQPGRQWEHLVISGANIANVLFDSTGNVTIAPTPAAVDALNRAVGQPDAGPDEGLIDILLNHLRPRLPGQAQPAAPPADPDQGGAATDIRPAP